MSAPPIEITLFSKASGPLTKAISLTDEGSVRTDGSACRLVNGSARRVPIAGVLDLASLLDAVTSDQAITLGRLRPDLGRTVRVVTKAKLNGGTKRDVIARTGEFLRFATGEPAYALVDFDRKGMPQPVADAIDRLGGFEAALESVIPLSGIARVSRASTSAGLYRADTGEAVPLSGGAHLYIEVVDGSDIDRFLHDLHARCWLSGLGWMIVGAGGQYLDRSIADRVVGTPERFVFEGPAVLSQPLWQDPVSRQAVAKEGVPLDTVAACPPLSVVEKGELARLKASARIELAPLAAKARSEFIETKAPALAARAGHSLSEVRAILERTCDRVLHPAVPLLFDDPELDGALVADVLRDPNRYVGETLADPLEGRQYGTGKAKIMRRADGALWIHSFAHGGCDYELKHDARAVGAALDKTPAEDVAGTFVRLVQTADLTAAQVAVLRADVSERAKIGTRVLDQMLKQARASAEKKQIDESRDRRLAERLDPRPEIAAPLPDAPWLPQMAILNEVLSKSAWPEPPARNLEAVVTQVWIRQPAGFHELTTAGSNEEELEESRLPPPEQPLLTPLSEPDLAELIEQHIDYVVEHDGGVRSVHLAGPFVKHFLVRKFDKSLPVIRAVTTLPMVLKTGELLAGRGLNRDRSLVFRIPDELLTLLPLPEQCTSGKVVAAMAFLINEWLVDVAADYGAKCTIIAKALTIIERHLLAERPGFITTAGQRRTGKTVEQHMVSTAVLGHRATAAAWTFDETERRKSLFAYLSTGVALLVWDNIPRGAVISCPHIERALTTLDYTDRVLGESKTPTAPATTIQSFTGNNIACRGDLASRLLEIRLFAERPDPENREFVHPDPIGWTLAHRGQILAALYTILLGNPRFRSGRGTPAKTRFKDWYHLVGAAVEHAAKQHSVFAEGLAVDTDPACKPVPIDFAERFLSGETGEEQTASVATILSTLRGFWPQGCTAQNISRRINDEPDAPGLQNLVSALELASSRQFKAGGVTAPQVTWRLKAIKDQPASVDGKVLFLREFKDHDSLFYRIAETKR